MEPAEIKRAAKSRATSRPKSEHAKSEHTKSERAMTEHEKSERAMTEHEELEPAGALRANLEDRLLRQLRKTCQRYDLLAAGDRILVAISGGKDSYTMLHLLLALHARLPFRIELVAVHLDQRQPGYDGRALEAWLEARGVPFEILTEDTYSVVTTHLDEASTYCSLCSRLRRGILYTRAKALGCNKIALGHHREDSLETFLLNLFFAGKLQAMPAAYTTDDGELRVIRPLVECDEAEIARFAELERFPIVPCRLCGSQPGQKRDLMGEVIAKLETVQPNVRATMLNALRNVRPTHLLDREVEEAWSTRPPHIRPTQPPRPRKAHAAALPVRASKGRLPIVSDGNLGGSHFGDSTLSSTSPNQGDIACSQGEVSDGRLIEAGIHPPDVGPTD